MPVPNPALRSATNAAPRLDLQKVVGNMQPDQILFEVNRGARFVIYQYCISALIITFRRNSPIQFVHAGESPAIKGLGYSLLSLVLGWWGFPWGFIYTPMVIYKNFNGGTDVTQAVVNYISGYR